MEILYDERYFDYACLATVHRNYTSHIVLKKIESKAVANMSISHLNSALTLSDV